MERATWWSGEPGFRHRGQPCKGPEAGEGLVGLRVSNGGHMDGPLMGSGSHSEQEGGQEGSKSRTDVI